MRAARPGHRGAGRSAVAAQDRYAIDVDRDGEPARLDRRRRPAVLHEPDPQNVRNARRRLRIGDASKGEHKAETIAHTKKELW